LAFAVAVHLEPEILILDEVLAVGDAAFREKCQVKMREVSGKGRTVFYVSHDLTSIQQLCGRAFLIESGQLIDEGDPKSVTANYLKMISST
jgi:lipopolysaccharide transport system ATP-binding protein